MAYNNLTPDLATDINAIQNVHALPSLLNVICKTTGMRFAAISRITDSKWITCITQDEINFGLKPGDELDLQTTLCNEIRQNNIPIIIDNVKENTEYCFHSTPALYGFESYISFPIYRKNGDLFGTLCAIDPIPKDIDNVQTRELFKLYTDLISFYLEAANELELLNINLREEQKIAELRETFIAILGHDLRNPVGTTRMCADILLNTELSDFARRQASTIKSTSYRMQGLIDNLLDFAKGHLGDGIRLELVNNNQLLKKSLNQVTKEIRTIDSQHKIITSIELTEAVPCDINRIGQLFSNLLGNAIKHGAPNEPIFVEISTTDDKFRITVRNSGKKLSQEIMDNLFKPFFTKNSENNKSGLGLGLYISTEIAKAHNGTMSAESEGSQISFTFSMPLHQKAPIN